MSNKRVIFTKAKSAELRTEKIPTLKNEKEVLVEIKAAGICGSDLHYYRHGGLGSFKASMPMHVGHEPAGIIIKSNSKIFNVNDRVAIEPANPDLSDEWCLNGRHNLASGTFMGANSEGCMTNYMLVHENQCVNIPDNMSYEAASLLEPIAVALHAINRGKITYRDSVSIVGVGAIGLCILLCLKKIGVKNVQCVDPLDYRRKKALELGANKIISSADFRKLDKTNVSIDACGNDESINISTNLCEVGGRLLIVGIPESDYISINPHILRTREIDILNIRRSDRTLHDSLTLFADTPELLESLITHKFKLKDCNKAFQIASSYSDNIIKGVFNPSH